MADKLKKEPCVTCGNRRPPSEFKRYEDGALSRYCLACSMTPKVLYGHCQGCNERKIETAFDRYASGALPRFCRACVAARPPRLRKCRICKVSKDTKENFAEYPGRKTHRNTCLACEAQKQPKLRACKKCGRVAPVKEFPRYACGESHRHCAQCAKPGRVMGEGPHLVPHPCNFCGKRFYAKGTYSRVKLLRVCSHACWVNGRRRSHVCKRCRKRLPFTEFDVNDCGRNRRSTCRACYAEARKDGAYKNRAPPSATMLLLNGKRGATAEGLPFDLTRPQMKQLYLSPCDLCGRAPWAMRLKEQAPGWTAANIRPLCARCNRLVKDLTFAEVLLLAHEIAARNPLDPKVPGHADDKSPSPGRAPKRRGA